MSTQRRVLPVINPTCWMLTRKPHNQESTFCHLSMISLWKVIANVTQGRVGLKLSCSFRHFCDYQHRKIITRSTLQVCYNYESTHQYMELNPFLLSQTFPPFSPHLVRFPTVLLHATESFVPIL